MPRKHSTLLKRRLKIAEIVSAQGGIKVDELSSQLKVSGVTIRSDLNYLEQQGYLIRSFGGAVAAFTQPFEKEWSATPESLPLTTQLEMVNHCLMLIQPRDTLFLGHGKLCRKLIPLLHGLKNIRLIVNDLEHALLANQFIDGEIIIAGSNLLRSEPILTGKSLERTLHQHSITHCILEINTAEEEGSLGITPRLLADAYQQCLDIAKNRIALFNASKPGTTISQFHQFDKIILCRNINEHYQQHLLEAQFILEYTHSECFTWSNEGSGLDPSF